MPKRRSDAYGRPFFHEFASVRVSRLRAAGVIDPTKRYALIPIGEKTKLLYTAARPFPERRWLVLIHLSEIPPAAPSRSISSTMRRAALDAATR
jgi:hypothetical protein